MTVVDIARLFLSVREAGANKGNRVEAIQHWGGGMAGQSWCCWFATMVLDLFYSGASPIPRMGACQDVYDLAKKNGWLTPVPSVGDIFLYVNDQDHAHHIGFVTSVLPLTGIAGNTSEDGTSSNGDRVAEHSIGGSHVKYVHYQK
jgi:hypothetical protein